MRLSKVLLGVLLAPALLAAAGEAESSQAGKDWRYSLAAAALHMPEVDLDDGGRTGLDSYHLRVSADRPVGKSTSLGISANYDTYDRDFSGSRGFAALSPWDTTHRFGVTGSLTRRINFVSLGLRPFVSWFSEDAEPDSDAMSWGASFAAVVGLSPERRIGIGARVARDLDDSFGVSPIVIVNWEINDKWVISNPHETTFTVPAGLELRYRHGEKWRFAVAGVYQSTEFRLDDEGLAPGGIGESDGLLSFLRVTRRWSQQLTFNAYLGALIDGELSVEDNQGVELADNGYDTAPFAALSIEGSF